MREIDGPTISYVEIPSLRIQSGEHVSWYGDRRYSYQEYCVTKKTSKRTEKQDIEKLKARLGRIINKLMDVERHRRPRGCPPYSTGECLIIWRHRPHHKNINGYLQVSAEFIIIPPQYADRVEEYLHEH